MVLYVPLRERCRIQLPSLWGFILLSLAARSVSASFWVSSQVWLVLYKPRMIQFKNRYNIKNLETFVTSVNNASSSSARCVNWCLIWGRCFCLVFCASARSLALPESKVFAFVEVLITRSNETSLCFNSNCWLRFLCCGSEDEISTLLRFAGGGAFFCCFFSGSLYLLAFSG